MPLLPPCTPLTEIIDVPTSCLEGFGQVQKVIFQRVFDGAVKNEIVIVTDNPNVLATWTTLQAAADGTKVTISPHLQNPESEAGAPRTFGGGNQTTDGIELIIGSEPSTFTSIIYNTKQHIAEALKGYMLEQGLGVFLVNEDGNIAGITDDILTPTTFAPFPIQSFFVGDKKLGMYEAPDENAVQWSYPANWSDKFLVVETLDFNANTDL